MKLRTRVLLLTIVLVVLVLGGTLGVVQLNLSRDIMARADADLDRATTGFRAYEQQRTQLLAALAGSLETNPTLRLLINTTNRATVTDFLEEVKSASPVDFITLTDYEGGLVASTSKGPTEEKLEFTSIREALQGFDTAGYWKLKEGFYQVYSIPMVSGGSVDGTVSMGMKVNNAVLGSLSRELGVQPVAVVDENIVASSLTFAPEQKERVARLAGSQRSSIVLWGCSYEASRLDLDQNSGATLCLLQDSSPAAALLAETKTQLVLLGLAVLLIALLISFPVVGRVTVSSELLETVVETVGEGLIHLDREGVVRRVNPEAAKLLGLPAESVNDKPLLDQLEIKPEADGPGLDWDSLKEGIRLEDGWLKSEHKRFPVSLVSRPIQENDELLGAVILFRDITTLKENERVLKDAVAVAEQASEAKARFLAHMSHEIRTPMNGVLGMNQLLLGTELTPVQKRYAETVQSSSEALLSVINDVLDFSKLEAERYELESIDFELTPLVEEIAILLAERARAKGVGLVCCSSPDLPDLVQGDPVRLRQVLINLTGNAIKFTDEGAVTLRVDRSGDKIRFRVTDTGIGIDPEVVPKLFTPFTQADASTSRRFGGTGLGLSISKSLVELMGGGLEVESVLGQGSTFGFSLALPVREPVSEPPRVLRGKTVVLCESSPARLDHLTGLLQFWGCRVVEIERASIELLPEHFDAIVTRAEWAANLASPTRTVALAWSGEDYPGFHLCPKPVQRHLFQECVVRAVQGEKPDQKRVVTVETAPAVTPASPWVLVADDNQVNRDVAVASLTRLGYNCESVENGAEAVAMFSSRSFAVVLMDCQMPVMDGFEASRAIREQNAEIPIIALTAGLLPQQQELMDQSGMNSILLKPFRLQELAECLGKWVGAVEQEAPGAEPERPGDPVQQEPCLDLAKLSFLEELSPGDPDFVSKLVDGFKKDLLASLTAFDEAAAGGRWEEIRGLAHKLKGGSGNLGVIEVERLSRALEEAEPQAGLIEPLLKEMRVAAEIALEALDAYVKGE